MRIALVHSFYASSSPSGENEVVHAQTAALREAGHEVVVVARSSDDIEPGPRGRVAAALRVSTGRGASPERELAEFRPDVVHVHNLFPNWSTAWARRWPGPIVATLHNFRHSCAAGTFYREGHACTSCLERGSLQSAVHRCYRDSVAATLPLTIATRRTAAGNPLLQRADAVVALSERAAELHVRAGVDRRRVAVVPHFVEDESEPSTPDDSSSARSGWIYVGRMAPEKGVAELVSAWPDGIRLDLLGSGPLESELSAAARPDIRFLGLRSPAEVHRAMTSARGLVFPSRWAEGAVPMVYLQALAAGTPVVALQGSSAADDVVAGGTGVAVADWSTLSAALREVETRWGAFAEAASTRHRGLYTRKAWLTRIDSVYDEVIARAAASSDGA